MTNWPHFITSLCLLPKLFSNMFFLFHTLTFDDVMKFSILNFEHLNISRAKRVFQVKIKNVFLV